MKIEKIKYHGWDDCVQLTHQQVQLIITTAVGPRIISCRFHDGGNLFYEHPQQAGTTGGDEWKTYGGHRFWCAPEELDFTYAPDNFPVIFQELAGGTRFTAPVEKSGVQKTVTISPIEGRNGFRVDHLVSNCGEKPQRLAPWALTVMSAGGTAVIPHNLERPRRLLPTHAFSLWGYTNLSDPRWHWGERYVLLRQDPSSTTAQKFGLQNPYGWAGYAVNGQFFLKRFTWQPGAEYPDFNVNFEAYTDKDILELETLAPLVTLKPGESVTHSEEWFVYRDLPLPRTEADIDRVILPLIN